MPINHTAAASMRYDISSAAEAAVATGFLKDLIADGHIPANKALDPSKVRKARENVMAGAHLKRRRRQRKKILLALSMMGGRLEFC